MRVTVRRGRNQPLSSERRTGFLRRAGGGKVPLTPCCVEIFFLEGAAPGIGWALGEGDAVCARAPSPFISPGRDWAPAALLAETANRRDPATRQALMFMGRSSDGREPMAARRTAHAEGRRPGRIHVPKNGATLAENSSLGPSPIRGGQVRDCAAADALDAACDACGPPVRARAMAVRARRRAAPDGPVFGGTCVGAGSAQSRKRIWSVQKRSRRKRA